MLFQEARRLLTSFVPTNYPKTHVINRSSWPIAVLVKLGAQSALSVRFCESSCILKVHKIFVRYTNMAPSFMHLCSIASWYFAQGPPGSPWWPSVRDGAAAARIARPTSFSTLCKVEFYWDQDFGGCMGLFRVGRVTAGQGHAFRGPRFGHQLGRYRSTVASSSSASAITEDPGAD